MRYKARPKLYRKFRQPDGKQSPYCRAHFDKKFRIRPFWCLVKGIEEFHPDGYYYRPQTYAPPFKDAAYAEASPVVETVADASAQDSNPWSGKISDRLGELSGTRALSPRDCSGFAV